MLAFTWPVFLVLALLALRGQRWAYAAFVVAGLTFFAARVGFRLQPEPCELLVSWKLALYSLTNHAHIVLFAMFFIISHAQVRAWGARGYAWAAAATLVMGALVEIAQGLSGTGHCRARDLIPDGAGAVLGLALVLLWQRLRRLRAVSPTPRAP